MPQSRYPAIDICDMPSDRNRIFGNSRKELLLSLRKVRRSPQYVDQLLELLAWVEDVAKDARGDYDAPKKRQEEVQVKVEDKPAPVRKTKARRTKSD
jgi:triphosphoribosyl-dephospho-CoA synthetase